MSFELLNETETFIEANTHLGYTTREEFIRTAIRSQLGLLKEQYRCIEIPKEEYDRLQQAIREMDTQFLSVDDFIEQQIRLLLEKYEQWLKQNES